MEFADSLTNLVAGIGTDRDKTAHGHFRWRAMFKAELDAIYENDWLGGSIVDTPCDDMTREWRTWKGGPRQVNPILKTERRLGVQQKVNLALKQARLYGGSAIIVSDGSATPWKELDPVTIKKGGLKFIHVMSRWEIFAGTINRDPLSPFYGQPSYYVVPSPPPPPVPEAGFPGYAPPSALSSDPPRGALYVHPSRVIRFLGQARLEVTRSIDGWGLSTLQRVYDAVRDTATTKANMVSMTHETKVDVVKIPGLTANVQSADYRSKLLARFQVANLAKSINNMLILDSLEEWEQKQLAFTQIPEVLRLCLEVAAGAADIPLTRLLGTSPKGMNATGESDLRNYYDSLAARQRIEVSPCMAPLDELLVRDALGARPDNVDYDWNPLWQIRESERAVIDLQRAQTAQIHATMGAMPPDALAAAICNALIRDNTFPGLEELLEKYASQPRAPLALKQMEQGAEINVPAAHGVAAKS